MRFEGASSEVIDFLETLEAPAGDFLITGPGEFFTEMYFLIKGAGDFFIFNSGTGDLEAGLALVDLGRIGSGDFFLLSGDFFLISGDLFLISGDFFLISGDFFLISRAFLAFYARSFLDASNLRVSFFTISSASLF
jgi:hypothetical protein